MRARGRDRREVAWRCELSDEIEPAPGPMSAAACRTNARDYEAMADWPEAVPHAYRVAQLQDLVVSKLDNPVTLGAMQMVV
jgi:hypothetical protein